MSSSASFTVVTGANGFIASHIVSNLLAKGTPVLGTVRSFNKASKLISKFSKEFKNGKLKFIEVDFDDKESIERIFTKYGSEIKNIIHPAQNFGRGASTAQELDKELIKYTIDSVNTIIEVVENSKAPIERFVYFSTSVAVRDVEYDKSHLFTEDDFAGLNHEEAVKSWLKAYTFGKVSAEKIVLNHKSKRGIEYKIVVPPTVIGPPAVEWDSVDEIDGNNRSIYNLFKGKEIDRGVEWYADVRSIADAAVQASERSSTPELKTNRYVIVDGDESYWDALPIFIDEFSKYDPGNWNDLVKKGVKVNENRITAKRDLSKTEKDVKHKPIPLKETVHDVTEHFITLESKDSK